MRAVFVFAVLCFSVLAQAPAAGKKRVAILDFDYATVHSGVAAIFGTNVDVGRGIADILVDRLVKDGTYSVIERKALAKILAEQNFYNSDRADATSAAKIGRLLGVETIIIGSITQFGRDDRQQSVGGGVFSGAASRYGLGRVGARQSKAVVAINARMVSVDTGEILTVASGTGESKRSGAMLGGAGGSGGTGAGGAIDMSSSNFGATILGEAVHAAVTQLSGQLAAGSGKIATRVVAISGAVADVSGNTLVINVGSRAGVKVGDRLKVFGGGREIRDPSTGKVLRRVGQTEGDLVITEVDETSSVGTYTGPGPVKVGDTVKSASQ